MKKRGEKASVAVCDYVRARKRVEKRMNEREREREREREGERQRK